MPNGIAVLMYHELEVPGRKLCLSDPGYLRYVVTASALQSQLQHLNTLGYRGIDLGRALQAHHTDKFALTFDDGCESDFLVAAPILSALGFGATFYVTVGSVGKPGYLTESQLRELSVSSFEIGCHSMTHPHLPDLDATGLHREIVEAKLRLEQIIGRSVEHYSCPGGLVDSRVVAKVKEAGFLTLANSRPRLYTKGVGPYLIGRIPILRNSTPAQVEAICEGRGLWKLGLEYDLRSVVARVLGNRVYEGVRTAVLSASRPK